MSVDPSSFNFNTGMSNVDLNTVGNDATSALQIPSPNGLNGPLTEADMIAGGTGAGVGSSGMPTVNIGANLGTIDPSSIGNPFAGANGGAPITASNFNPTLQNISFNQSGIDQQLQQELGLTTPNGGAATPGASKGSGFSFGNVLNDAALFGLGAYGLSQAKQAQTQIAQQTAPLQSESSNLLQESQNLIGNYNTGQMPGWAQSTYNQLNGEGNQLFSNYTNSKLPSAEQAYANQLKSTGSQLLDQYHSGTAPKWAQSYIDWTSQEATNLLNSAPQKALQSLATQMFTDYSSGKLMPGDQVALNQQVASQKQRVASMLSATGDADSSVLAAQYSQIDQQAAMTRQNILNSYFHTGDSAYNSWLNTNTQAAQIKAQGAQFANQVFGTMLSAGLQSLQFAANYTQAGLGQELAAGTQLTEAGATFKQQTFDNMLQAANQFANTGDQALTQAIGIQLQSDNNLSQTVGDLMKAVAASYAYSSYMNKNNPQAAAQPGGGGSSFVGNVLGGVSTFNSLVGAGRTVAGLFSAAGGGAAAALPAGMSGVVGAGATGAELGTAGSAVSAPISVAGGGAAAAGAGAGLSSAAAPAAAGGFAEGGASGAAASTAGTASLGALASGIGILGAAAYGVNQLANRNSEVTNVVTQLTSDPASGFKLNPAGQQATYAGGGGIGGTVAYSKTPNSAGYTTPYSWNGKTFHGNEDQAAQLWNAYKTGTGSLQAYQQYMQANSG